MDCVECGTSVQTPALVTFTTGKVKQLPLCTDCRKEYEEGAFVSSVSNDSPTHGGEPQKIAKCTDCGEIYPAQMTAEDGLRPVGLEDGSCVCGNTEFQPFIDS
ncbi:MAG: hypothetical protein ABEH90_04495 [Halolamina sp.]